MLAQVNTFCEPSQQLRQIVLLDDLCHAQHKTLRQADLICQAMLPEIRTTALLIAAQRHDFTQVSPQRFSDEADWLAAQILVLKAKIVHLPQHKMSLLNLANQRAQQFAQQHHLPFEAAQSQLLNTTLPKNAVMLSCTLMGTRKNSPIENTLSLRQNNLTQ